MTISARRLIAIDLGLCPVFCFNIIHVKGIVVLLAIIASKDKNGFIVDDSSVVFDLRTFEIGIAIKFNVQFIFCQHLLGFTRLRSFAILHLVCEKSKENFFLNNLNCVLRNFYYILILIFRNLQMIVCITFYLHCLYFL